jgi:hypothetical protein
MDTTLNKYYDTFKIIGNWDIQSNKLKRKYSQLTDADLEFEPGCENQLLTRVAIKLNKKREEVIDIIKKVHPENL